MNATTSQESLMPLYSQTNELPSRINSARNSQFFSDNVAQLLRDADSLLATGKSNRQSQLLNDLNLDDPNNLLSSNSSVPRIKD